MKKYFSKYLPVSGEIKEGDFAKSEFGVGKANTPKSGGIYVYYEDENQEGVNVLLSVHKTTPQKVKLFLCSRDIQVGDKIKATELQDCVYDSNINNTDIRVRWENDFMTTANRADFFKVIGEISPDALSYVKEGQEFDEDEVEEWWINKDISYFVCPAGTQPINDKHKYPKLKHFGKGFKVKGPCGRFH